MCKYIDINSLWKKHSTAFLVILLAFFSLALGGCDQLSGAVRHGWEGYEYENTYFSVNSPLGARALNNWRDYDIKVRQFLEKYRNPDVIYSGISEVNLFYLKEKVQVRFYHPYGIGWTKVEQTEIPESLHDKLMRLFK